MPHYLIKNIGLIIFFPLLSLAQEYSFSGQIIRTDTTPIPVANVILMDKNETAVKWHLTDDSGTFLMEEVRPGSYTFKVSGLGYQTKTAEVIINNDIVGYQVILEEQTLDEVIVTSVQPRIERKADRLIFNVQNTMLSNGTVWNVLKKTPYLSTMGNDLLVKGSSTPVIYINDKQIYLSSIELQQLLENTPADMLKSVEVILIPPAKYDAEGGTVVNIIMKKNLNTGYSGNASGSYEQGVYPKYRFSTGHFYKIEKIDLYARYSHQIKKEYVFFRDRITFFTDDLPSGEWLSETQDDIKLRHHDLSTNIDYTISDNHTLSFSGMASLKPKRNRFTGSQTLAYRENQQIDSSFYTISDELGSIYNTAVSLDYKYNLGKRRMLTMNIHRTAYRYDQDQTIITDYMDSQNAILRNNSFTNDKKQDVGIYTAQADYTTPIGEKSNFEAGAKWTYITFDNRISQTNIEGTNQEFFDRFLYDETTFAAYMSYEKDWTRWNAKVGIRGEDTALKGNSSFEDQTNIQDYFKVFPSLYLGYRASENHSFTLSYDKKITRPRFGKLNPFKSFLNDNSYTTGNPRLLPTIDDRLTLNYTLKRTLNFELYIKKSTNPIAEIPYVDNADNKLIYRNENLDKTFRYGMDAQWSKSVMPWWYIDTYFSLYYGEHYFYAFGENNNVLKINRWITYQRITNSFTFTKDKTFAGDIGVAYNSKRLTGNAVMGGRAKIFVELRKDFWNKRATLSFYGNDIFNTLLIRSKTQYLDQNIESLSDFEYRTFEIVFLYRFGNYKLRTNRKSINSDETRRL